MAEVDTSGNHPGQHHIDQNTTVAAPSYQHAPPKLTARMLAIHDGSFDHFLHAAQTIVKAIDVQTAAKDLSIDLPLHCYMHDRSELDGWVRQQSQ
jgi:hypothetical protein